MLVDRHTKRLDVPGEPGEWIEVRRLTFGERHELLQESGMHYLEELSGLPADVLEAQLKLTAEMKAARQAAREEAGEPAEDEDELPEADALAGMDLLTVLRFGIVAWSYREASGEPVPVEPATVAMLDEDTARFAARSILLLGNEARDASLKGSSPLTATSTE